MAQKIDKILLQLDMKGFPLVKGFAKDIQKLGQSLNLNRTDIAKFASELNNFENQLGKVGKFKTQNQFNTQISLLKKLQNNVPKASAAYKQLGLEIKKVTSEMSNPKLNRVTTAAIKEYQRRGNLGRNLALEQGTGSFKGFSQGATEITNRANMAASGRAFLGSADAQLRPMSGLAEQIQQIGLSQVDAKFQRLGQSVSQVRQDILGAAQAGGNNVNALNAQRAALETLRNGVDIGSQKFRQLTKDIQGVERRLNSLTKFSGKNLLGAGQGLLGATFVGGGAGLAGGLAGMGVEALRPGGNLQQGAITGGLIGSQLISPAAQFVSGSAQYASGIAKSQIALRKATEVRGEDGTVNQTASLQAYNRAMHTATKVTKDFNIPQELAIRGMTRLGAAVIGAGGNVNNATRAFTSVLAAIKGTAGGTEDAKAAITALVQIYSKGRVSAEELSGQLGERFPAAVTKFADANDMTTQELQKSLKNGTVGLAELEKFVIALGEEYIGVAKEIGASSEEAGARSQIAFNELKLALGNDLKEVGAEFQEIGIRLMSALVPSLKVIAKAFTGIAKFLVPVIKGITDNIQQIGIVAAVVAGGLAGIFVPTLIKVAAGLSLASIKAGILTVAMKVLTVVTLKANLAALANPWVALAAGLTAAGIAAYRFATATDRMIANLKSGDATTDELTEALHKRYEIESKIKTLEESKAFKLGRSGTVNQVTTLKQDLLDLTNAIKTFKDSGKDLGEDFTKEFDKITAAINKAGKDTKSALETYGESVGDFTGQIENATVNAFKGMEDALTNFVMTGKLNFADFARSIIADLARIAIRAAIIQPLGAAFGLPGFAKGGVVKSAKGNVFAQNKVVPFAYGGIVNKPTLFPMRDGMGLMGEAGPEAVVPLKRTRQGRLGIESSGGGGNIVNVTVNASGTSADGNTMKANQLGKMIGTAIEAELIKQKRPGGILYT